MTESICRCVETENRSEKPVSFAEFWQPGRIVSLWDMMRWLNLFRFSATCHWVGLMMGSDLETQFVYEHAVGTIKEVLDIAKSLDLSLTATKSKRLLTEYEGKSPAEIDWVEFRADYLALWERFVDEVTLKTAFVVDAGAVEFYNTNQFSIEVQKAFGAASYDMVEAGRCFALRRFPACVFHLYRIYDAGVKRLGKRYEIRTNNDTLGEIIQGLRDKVKEAKKGGRESELRLTADLVDRLSDIKEPRNFSFHSDERLSDQSLQVIKSMYDAEDADRIFKSIVGLMDRIVSAISQSGISS